MQTLFVYKICNVDERYSFSDVKDPRCVVSIDLFLKKKESIKLSSYLSNFSSESIENVGAFLTFYSTLFPVIFAGSAHNKKINKQLGEAQGGG